MSSPGRKRKDKLKSKLRYHFGRAIQYGVPAEKITVGQWNEKLRQHDHRCVYCQKSPTKRQRRLTFDHAIPLAKGGTHTIENLGIDISGRMSSSQPNLQNHVKHTELGQQILAAFRGLFVHDEWNWVGTPGSGASWADPPIVPNNCISVYAEEKVG